CAGAGLRVGAHVFDRGLRRHPQLYCPIDLSRARTEPNSLRRSAARANGGFGIVAAPSSRHEPVALYRRVPVTLPRSRAARRNRETLLHPGIILGQIPHEATRYAAPFAMVVKKRSDTGNANSQGMHSQGVMIPIASGAVGCA